MQLKRLIGINGGTFDPIHFGHLRPALEVLNALHLDEMRFVPAYQPVHRDTPQVSAEQRCEMIELAIKNQPKFKLDRIEIEMGGPSYMVQTLEKLKQQESDAMLVLMMGTDAFAKFDTWRDWQRILKLANLVVTHRPGEPVPSEGEIGRIFHHRWVPNLTQEAGQIVDLPITQLDLSATALRSYLTHGDPVDYLMPESVARYIKEHKLYR
ncbi:nicotinate-nucleotide adenylyltransferase [Hydrogenovibrio kuenenii]|uniref:nicotinate-nucleotide adenylyltransferase n=1 Tax=Hydrogenovibrio kuenenii TaxID=63658 RepID=UPI0004646DE5|nr:nicotinate-nucleotide adenylyltransferase [Hydrogenovibrio kuenenii]